MKWHAERGRMPSSCRAEDCGKRLTWALTENGEWMPLDPLPTPAGNIIIVPLGPAWIAHVASTGEIEERAGAARYMPHWATCANPGQFRWAHR